MMNKYIYDKIFNLDVTSPQNFKMYIVNNFFVENIDDFFDFILDFIENNISYLSDDLDFFERLHINIYALEKITPYDKLTDLLVVLNKLLDVGKEFLKDYNKGLKSKNKNYNIVNTACNLLKSNIDSVNNKIINGEDNELYKIVWFNIIELKNIDYFFYLITCNKDLINVRSKDDKHVFVEVIDYYLNNLPKMNDNDIKYFKRIIVLFLESEKLYLTSNELYEILENAEDTNLSSSIKNHADINFLTSQIAKHYHIINEDFRKNVMDYVGQICPVEIINRSSDERTDFTNLFTVSIDTFLSKNISSLIDDAFSLIVNNDGTFTIYEHIPDVDYYVKKDSKTDRFMRNLGDSIYALDHKTMLLNEEIANKASLNQGKILPALTYAIKMDYLGNILDVSFYKSNIRVDYNLSKVRADEAMHRVDDVRLCILNQMYDIAKMLRKKRGETIGKRSKSLIIVDEFNIIADIAVASYFKSMGIVFPYKNYSGVKVPTESRCIKEINQFIKNNYFTKENKELLLSMLDANARVYYDTVSIGNKNFKGMDTGNVGNPLREYISLETNRLIKDLIISGEKNQAYWEERIERDCIEYTETSAIIKKLYKH